MTLEADAKARPAPALPGRAAGPSAPEWVDRFLGSDPGFVRLLTASQAVATIGIAMLVESTFVRLTGAMQIDTHGVVLPPAQAALVAAQHHGVLVVAVLLGAIIGMIASFTAAMFPTPRAQLVSFALMPVPMIAGLTVGLALAPHRTLALASFVVILGGGAYLRRFGPRGFVAGMLLFMGDFFGFFLHGAVTIADLDWLAAEICIGVLVAIVAQFTLFYPSRRSALRRMRRSYVVRAREVTAAALDLLSEPGNNTKRASRRLHRRLVRLNETALTIDAQLGQPAALPTGPSAEALHQRLFDAELALTNTARFAERISALNLSGEIKALARAALTAVGERDAATAELAAHHLLEQLRMESGRGGRHSADAMDRTTHVVVHRFAISVLGFSEAIQRQLPTIQEPSDATIATDPGESAFEPSVQLLGGFLPGSTMVSATASLESGVRPHGSSVAGRLGLGDRVRLAPYSRVAIQMGVAVTGAIILGDLLSGRRFYWAVIAAFVTFMGANNSGEQLRKGFLRVIGTVVGVFLGAILAHLVGNDTNLAIGVILVSLFFAIYLMRVSYAFMVIGITVMVSQLYVQLDEFTNSLLVLRLEETGVGAGVAALTVLFVFPLHTGRVLRVATRQYVQALAAVVSQAVQLLAVAGAGDGASVDGAAVDGAAVDGAAVNGAVDGDAVGNRGLRAAVRRLDVAYQALVVTVTPLRYSFARSADDAREQFLQSVAASRHYARNLLVDTAAPVELPLAVQDELQAAGRLFIKSLDELATALDDHHRSARTYVRAASQFDLVASQLRNQDLTAPIQLALRDFQLADGAMATLAKSARLTVRALDEPDRELTPAS